MAVRTRSWHSLQVSLSPARQEPCHCLHLGLEDEEMEGVCGELLVRVMGLMAAVYATKELLTQDYRGNA